jgi:peptidoglycan hydrolase-like protein with peptidoglycan-binding domain
MDIVTRKDWGARAPLGTSSVIWALRQRVVVHHTTGSNLGRDDPAEWLRAIQDYHMDTNGWSDIGYNHAVDRTGRLYELRGWTRLGAHVLNHNTPSLGLVLLGDGRVASNVTDPVRASIRWYCREADRRAGRLLDVVGHGELAATQCPGTVLQEWVDAGMPLPKGGAVPAPPPAPVGLVLPVKPVIRQSATRPARGSALERATKLLQASIRYVHGISEVGAVDGWAGPATATGIRMIQTRHRLVVDGACGPQTWPRVLT